MKSIYESYHNKRLILFIGAGASCELGLPSWNELIEKIANNLGYEPEVFKSYGNHRELAEYYKLETKDNDYKLLRASLKKKWIYTKPIQSSRLHELIAKSNFETIYTTNYDNCLEDAFSYYKEAFTKVVNVTDLNNSNNKNKRRIIKFHGDLNESTNFVLDESSYFERLEFDNPLDIKFRADILNNSILFIGYSISDINVRQLLYKLHHTWRKHGNGALNAPSYIFSNTPNPIQKKIFASWETQMISPINHYDSPSTAICLFLEALCNHKYSEEKFLLFN